MAEELKDWLGTTAPKVMRTPRSLSIEITARCNLHCRYCYFFNNPAMVYRDLPGEALVEALSRTLIGPAGK